MLLIRPMLRNKIRINLISTKKKFSECRLDNIFIVIYKKRMETFDESITFIPLKLVPMLCVMKV